MSKPHHTLLDKFILQVDNCLKAIGSDQPAERPYPADTLEEAELSESLRKQSAGFMRVNHSGEVCAQALYNGQALVARNPDIQKTLTQCGNEETDHLAWCNQRLNELNSHRSYLNPLWYWNSFFIGVIAGLAGDPWSLGFVEETEIQVGKHLQTHLDNLTPEDKKTSAIIKQMQADEAQHAQTAKEKGAKELPAVVKKAMTLHAKVMTTLAYWV